MFDDAATREGQPKADLGAGYYRNPILPGNYPDPSVVRVGADYYMVNGGAGAPGLLIWRSRDLVNWQPACHALQGNLGALWAPELVHERGLFYLYVPIVQPRPDGTRRFSNWVLTAERVEGPWSAPIDLHLDGAIDPGHVADAQGNRYLYVNGGRVAPLAPDGLSVTGPLRKVYDGWPIPEEWIVECHCLESPKFTCRDGWFYLTSAQGGTAGPATSHMIVVARSRSPLGPWENSPYGPLLHTRSRGERWWSQGHGTLVDDIAGRWWVVYHAFENGYRSLGRQTLLLPVEWTPDGWPRIANDAAASEALRQPAGEAVPHGLALSDGFFNELGMQWSYEDEDDALAAGRYRSGGGALRIQAKGQGLMDAAFLGVTPVNRSYVAQVEFACSATSEGGLVLYGQQGRECFGAGARTGQALVFWHSRQVERAPITGERLFLRLVNREQDVAIYYSGDGRVWRRFDRGMDVGAGEWPLKLGLYAAGEGEVVFRDFRYHGLD